jgi:hypothetical protein
MKNNAQSIQSGFGRNPAPLSPTPLQLIPRIVLLLALIALCMAIQRPGNTRSALPSAPETPLGAR